MCAGLYDPCQFNYVVYEGSSGGLSTPESDQRLDYYGIDGYPNLVWDGTDVVPGAGPGSADGSEYIPIIDAHLMTTTPLALAVTGWSSSVSDAFVDLKVKLFDDLASSANTYVRVALVENNITYEGHDYYDRILRDMIPDATGTALSIGSEGEEHTLHLPFTWDLAWDPAECIVVAWVQRDSDGFIYNSISSTVGEFAVLAAVEGGQQLLGAPSQPIVFGATSILNVGIAQDTYDVTLDTSAMTDGWSATFTHDGVEGTSTTFSLDPMTHTSLFVTMAPGPLGTGRARLDIYSHGGGEIVESLDLVGVAGGMDVLVVADDGQATYAQDYFAPAVIAAGRTYAIWDRDLTAVTGAQLAGHDAVIWQCGEHNPSLGSTDRTALDTFLAGGGSLLLTGQDIAQDINNQGGAARTWFQFKTKCRFLSGDENNPNLHGVAGDPIGDGLSFSLVGGDGADNQTDPDIIQTLTGAAVPILRYGSNTLAGARVETNGYKIVLLAFGFEGISAAGARHEAMDNVLTWLIGPATPVQDAPRLMNLAQNTPNPFNPLTHIEFTLNRDVPVRLAVYDLQGRLVRTLVDESRRAGNYVQVWNGRDEADRQVASGMYVYRLTADGTTLSRKMALLK